MSAPPPGPAGPATAPLVLVVDDDLDIRRGLHECLEDAGFRVASAWNGVDALHYLERAAVRPSAILLDLMMPVMGGETFLEHLRASTALAQIPVIVISVREKPSVPVHGYLRKPFDLNRLVDSVRRVAALPAGLARIH